MDDEEKQPSLEELMEKMTKAHWKTQTNLKRRLELDFLRLACIQLLGGKCVRCGNSDSRVLQIDHKHGGGKKLIRGISAYTRYKRLALGIDSADDFQLLCANCNWIKRHENHEAPDASD